MVDGIGATVLQLELKQLVEVPELQGKVFGISRVQRYMRMSYNQASRLVEAAIDLDILERDPQCDWLLRFVDGCPKGVGGAVL